MARILYFGQAAELANTPEEQRYLQDLTVSQFKLNLENTIAGLSNINYQIAVNQSIVDSDFVLSDEMEIAILPPFAGG